MIDLLSLSTAQIAEILPENTPRYTASQIFTFLQNGKNFDEMTSLKKDLREYLKANYVAQPVTIREVYRSRDKSEKYLFLLADGNIVEGVYMPHDYGDTVCVSTQVGCPMGCAFCASGLNGLIRNLTGGEIAGQVVCANALHGGDVKNRKITNIVLMGSGEPLANFDNTIAFLDVITDKGGLNVSERNISLSTSGIPDKIVQLGHSGHHPTLSVSLHAPFDDMRSSIMPVNDAHPIAEVMSAAKEYFELTGRRVIFEYSLINGKNDTAECAIALSKLVKGFPTHVNLIRLNPVPEHNLKGSDPKAVKAFLDVLSERGVSATIRRSFGEDIAGACGQLRASFIKSSENAERN